MKEYLNLTFKQAGYEHPENRTGKGRIPLFKNKNKYPRFPDFKKQNIIADAKYKVLLRHSKDLISEDLSRDDLNQMITYLHITSSRTGIFVNPLNFRVVNPDTGDFFPEEAFCTRIGELSGDGGHIYIIGVNIPQESLNYADFSQHMSRNEGVLLKIIQEIKPNIDKEKV